MRIITSVRYALNRVKTFAGFYKKPLKSENMERKELELERKCRAHARAHGWACCKLEKNGCKGIPDDLFISPSQKCVLIEFKKDEKQKPRPEQKIWLQRFDRIAFLVGSWEEFCAVLDANE